jgi:hypothetical protein
MENGQANAKYAGIIPNVEFPNMIRIGSEL